MSVHTSSRIDWLLATMLSMSLCANAILGTLQYNQWRQSGAQTRRQIGISVGERVSGMVAKRVGAGLERVDFTANAAGTVLYVHTSTCIWCERNLANLRALASGAITQRLILLSLDENDDRVEQYSRSMNVSAPSYYAASAESVVALGLGRTPTTLVLDPSGRVTHKWTGAYVASTLHEIQQFFNISLPGIPTSLDSAQQGDAAKERR